MHFNSEYVSQSFRQKEFIFSDTLVPGIDRFSVIVSDITSYFVKRDVASYQTCPYYDDRGTTAIGHGKGPSSYFQLISRFIISDVKY